MGVFAKLFGRNRDALIADLGDADNKTREAAAEGLRKNPDPRAYEALIAALDDPYDMVRRFAAGALGKLGDARAVPRLVEQAKTHEDSGSRSTATAALGDIGDPSALEPLIGLLSDSNATVRACAADSLGKLGDGRAVAPLLACLRDSQYGVRGRSIEALGAIGDSAAVEPLADYYWSTEGDRRVMARDAWERALQRWREQTNVDELVAFLKMDTSGEPIVKSIATSLGLIGKRAGARR